MRLECAECGSELATYESEATVEVDGEFDITAHQGEGHELTVSWDEPNPEDRYQDKDRHGKPIKNFRYMKHLYYATATGKVECSCGAEADLTATTDEASGSDFDLSY